MLSVIEMKAEEVSITFSEQGYSNAQAVTECKVGDYITITFDKGIYNENPKYYTTGAAIRLYSRNTMKISTSKNIVLNSVEINTQNGDYVIDKNSTTDKGNIKINGTKAIISDINSNEVTFTRGGDSGHTRVLSIKITYTINENYIELFIKNIIND